MAENKLYQELPQQENLHNTARVEEAKRHLAEAMEEFYQGLAEARTEYLQKASQKN